MIVTLSPKLEALVKERVESGLYEDATEVVYEALLLLDDRDRLDRLRASIVESKAQFERGETETWSPELMQRLIAEGDELYRQGVRVDPDVQP